VSTHSYKSFSGKINSYALRAQAMPKQYAVQVIEDTHEHWKSLHIVNKRSVLGPGEAVTRPVAEGADVNVTTEHSSKPQQPRATPGTIATDKPGAIITDKLEVEQK
jgi:hypothetical protein